MVLSILKWAHILERSELQLALTLPLKKAKHVPAWGLENQNVLL